jgi:hypothetical protein
MWIILQNPFTETGIVSKKYNTLNKFTQFSYETLQFNPTLLHLEHNS